MPDDYLLIILSVSFFDYSSSQGGLWNYINTLFLSYLLFSGRWRLILKPHLKLVLPSFVIIALMGLVFINPADFLEKISFLLVFSSFILAFIFASQIPFTLIFFTKLSRVLLFIVIYQFVICINQRLEIFHSIMPFLPSQPDIADYDLREFGLGINKVRNWGSISNFELFAEVNSMLFVFYVCSISFYTSILKNENLIVTSISLVFFSFLNVLLSGTRSSLIIILIFLVIIGFIQIRKVIFNRKVLTISLSVIFFLVVFSNLFVKAFGLETLVLRLGLINTSEINISTGAGMNRQGTFKLALERIGEESLAIGNGYAFGPTYSGIMKGNHVSEFADFHNLYLSLPFFYGWFGSILILLLFAIPLVVLFQKKRVFWIPFFFLWITFLINEYKIQFIRDPHYTMIIWILIGITYSFIGSVRYKVQKKLL